MPATVHEPRGEVVQGLPSAEVSDPRSVLFSRPARAALGVAALALLVELVPGLAPLRLFSARPQSAPAAPEGQSPASKLVVGEAEIATVSEGRSELAPGNET